MKSQYLGNSKDSFKWDYHDYLTSALRYPRLNIISDIDAILKQISEESVISVFQHFRRIPFDKDFARIKERLASVHAAAICWHSLMFVAIAKAKEPIEKVIAANHQYSRRYPVRALR